MTRTNSNIQTIKRRGGEKQAPEGERIWKRRVGGEITEIERNDKTAVG